MQLRVIVFTKMNRTQKTALDSNYLLGAIYCLSPKLVPSAWITNSLAQEQLKKHPSIVHKDNTLSLKPVFTYETDINNVYMFLLEARSSSNLDLWPDYADAMIKKFPKIQSLEKAKVIEVLGIVTSVPWKKSLYFKLAIDIRSKLNTRLTEIGWLKEVGKHLSKQKNFNLACNYIKQALRTLKLSKMAPSIAKADILEAIGILLFCQHKNEKAVSKFNTALIIRKVLRHNPTKHEVNHLNTLVRFLRKCKETTLALLYVQHSVNKILSIGKK